MASHKNYTKYTNIYIFFEESNYKISNFQTKVNRKSKNGHFWYVHFSNIERFW